MKHTSKIRNLAFSCLLSLSFGAVAASAVSTAVVTTFHDSVSGYRRANPSADLESVIGNYSLGQSTNGTYFGTFGIEKSESFNRGWEYNVSLNNGAIGGGESGAVDGKDIISVGTAWLYEQFAIGELTGFDYGSMTHATQLQNTIWELEGETSAPNEFGTFMGLVQGLDGYLNNYSGSAVKVMNLTSASGMQIEDHLIFFGSPQLNLLSFSTIEENIGDPKDNPEQQYEFSESVPDSGATLAMLLFGLAGLAAARRRV